MCEYGTLGVVGLNGQKRKFDACICDLIQVLNDNGFKTVASCCGHGHRPGSVIFKDGRELLIMPSYEASRKLDHLWPDIHGEQRGVASV